MIDFSSANYTLYRRLFVSWERHVNSPVHCRCLRKPLRSCNAINACPAAETPATSPQLIFDIHRTRTEGVRSCLAISFSLIEHHRLLKVKTYAASWLFNAQDQTVDSYTPSPSTAQQHPAHILAVHSIIRRSEFQAPISADHCFRKHCIST